MCGNKNIELKKLLDNNKNWVKQKIFETPDFFSNLSTMHNPKYLWIGCSDARVPANTIVGLNAGEVFVHRNVGNVVAHSDINVQTVISYAVDFLEVEHIIVTGHYDCGAIKATLSGNDNGRIEDWLFHIRDVVRENNNELKDLPKKEMINKLCELNVQTQVRHVAKALSVLNAWSRGKSIAIHGWIYSVKNGLLEDLNCTVKNSDDAKNLEPSYLIK